MLENFRRKIANVISPDKMHSYPFIELHCATPQRENKRSLERAHKDFEAEHGRPAYDDAEAWKWDREQLNEFLINNGHEPTSTEFVPSHFIEK